MIIGVNPTLSRKTICTNVMCAYIVNDQMWWSWHAWQMFMRYAWMFDGEQEYSGPNTFNLLILSKFTFHNLMNVYLLLFLCWINVNTEIHTMMLYGSRSLWAGEGACCPPQSKFKTHYYLISFLIWKVVSRYLKPHKSNTPNTHSRLNRSARRRLKWQERWWTADTVITKCSSMSIHETD